MTAAAETLREGTFPQESESVQEAWQAVYKDEFRQATAVLLPSLTEVAENVFTASSQTADQTIRDMRQSITDVAVCGLVNGHIASRIVHTYGEISSDPAERSRVSRLIGEYAGELMGRMGLDPEASRAELFDTTGDALRTRAGIESLTQSIHRRKDQVHFNNAVTVLLSDSLSHEAGEKLARYAVTGSKSALRIDEALTGIMDAAVNPEGAMERERAIAAHIADLREAVSDYLFKKNKGFHLQEPYERMAVLMGHMAAEMKLPKGMRTSMELGKLYDTFFPPVDKKDARSMFFTYRSKGEGNKLRVIKTSSDKFNDGKQDGPRKPDWKRIGQAVMILFAVGAPILSACMPDQTQATPDASPTMQPTDTAVPVIVTAEPLSSPTPDAGSMDGVAPLTSAAEIMHAVPGLAPIMPAPDVQTVSNSENLQDLLNAQGWLPVESQGMLAAFVRNGPTALCSISPLQIMVDPSMQIDQSTGELLANTVISEDNGILTFGRSDGTETWQVPRIIALPDNLPDGVSCLAAVNMSDARLSVLVIDGAGTVLGESGIVFTPDQDIQITNVNGEPALVVDGQEVAFLTPNGDVLAFDLPLPTETTAPTNTPEPPTPTPEPVPQNCLADSDIVNAASGVLGISQEAGWDEMQTAADVFASAWAELHPELANKVRQFGENSDVMFAIDERGVFADSNYTEGIPLIGYYTAERQGYSFTCGVFVNPAFNKDENRYYAQIIPAVLGITSPNGRWSNIFTNSPERQQWDYMRFMEYLTSNIGKDLAVRFELIAPLHLFEETENYGVKVDKSIVADLFSSQFGQLQTVEQINAFFGENHSQYHIVNGNMKYQLTAFQFSRILREKNDPDFIGPWASFISDPIR